jgi:hypothetical protein
MNIQRDSTVNSVGPTSGEFLGTFLTNPNDPLSNYPNGLVVITLTALDGTFSGFNFLVDSAVTDTVLATALAAINTGYHVLADIDWPPVGIGTHGGNTVPYPCFCHSLWVKPG